MAQARAMPPRPGQRGMRCRGEHAIMRTPERATAMSDTVLRLPAEPYAVSPKEAAALLHIDVSTLYRNYGNAMRSGLIRTLKIGRARRIIWQSLIAYIEAETRKAA